MADELRPLYDKMDVLQGQISHLSGEMRASMATINATMSERCSTRGQKIDDLADDHDLTKSRVAVLEQDKAKMIGGAVVAGGLVSGLITMAVKFLSVGGK